jgi:hypothetical protein
MHALHHPYVHDCIPNLEIGDNLAMLKFQVGETIMHVRGDEALASQISPLHVVACWGANLPWFFSVFFSKLRIHVI